jgi:hypothetical protein
VVFEMSLGLRPCFGRMSGPRIEGGKLSVVQQISRA